MKSIKRILALALALVMCMGMAVTASASEKNPGDGKVTISLKEADEHTYEVYQIFTGDAAQDTNGKWVLSNVKYGQSYGTAGEAVAEEVLNGITDAKVFADSIKGNVHDSVGALTGDAKLDVVPGYYMLVDETEEIGANEDRSAFVVQIVGGDSMEIAPKRNSVPTVEKTVDDGKKAATEYSVGDTITYTLKATLGDIQYYDSYELEFVDTMDAGLTYKAITEVKVNDSVITAGYDVTVPTGTSNVLKVKFDDVKAAPVNAGSNDVITVKYTVELNDKAVYKNGNTVSLNFSNDPTSDGKGTTDSTTEDEVDVYTFTLKFNKVRKADDSEDKVALNGAGFTLYDENGDVVDVINNENGNEFTFKGLGAGKYKLVETTVPAGYNKMADKEFTITAEADETGVTKLESTLGTEWDASKETGVISGEIENKKGALLPETGGIGTTMFYVVGGILAAGAGILLVTRKRMSKEQ